MIVGLTDSIVPRFPCVGKLRKGDEKNDPKRPGRDLEHFRFVAESPEVFAAFVRAYTATPASIRVYLPYATPDECFPHWMELWSAGAFQRRCNGKEMVCWRDGDGAIRTTPAPCRCNAPGFVPTKTNPRCTRVGRLEVIIPELIEEGFVGYVVLETHSVHDIINIYGSLRNVYEMRKDLRGVEFRLYRRSVEISTPGEEGRRVRRTKSLVFISPSPEWTKIQIELQRRTQHVLPGETASLLLSAPEIGADEDAGAVEAEMEEEPEVRLEPPQEPSQPPVDERPVAEYAQGVLTYMDRNGVRYVNVSGKFLPADGKAMVSDETMKRVEGLFDNQFEMKNHLKKHFGVMTVRALTWEQFAALLKWKKDGKADPRWYSDKLAGGMVEEAQKLGGVISYVPEDPLDILTRYKVPKDAPGAKELAEELVKLPDPYCLLEIAERFELAAADNIQLYTDIAGAINSGAMEFGDETFWEVVNGSAPF